MQVRDLFQGWQVSIRQTGQDWWVRLLDDEDTPVIAQTCPSIDVTGRLVAAWMRILDDTAELDGDEEGARRQVTARLSDAVAQMHLTRALPPPPPESDEESLRAWFTRQMEGG
jgi:hypothetical protein